MEFNKKQSALLYLDKNGFYFYEAGLESVISLAFLPSSVRDMDVINGASIMAQIKTFIEQYKIAPATIAMILSPNISFEKDIIGLTSDAQAEEVKKFIDTIPFESVLSKQYPIEKGVKVIGCNEDIYSELKVGFEKSAFSVDMVIPYQLLASDQVLIQNLTAENASQLLKRIDHLKQFTLLTQERERVQSSPNPNVKTNEKPKTNKTRLYAMAATFIILFAILGFMLLNMK